MQQPVILVTGGSRGIGKAIVQHFMRREWLVATCATTQSQANLSGAPLAMVCDVSAGLAVKSMIATVIQTFGRLDAMVNNAGIAGTNSLDVTHNDDLWQRMFAINMDGTYHVSKYGLPHLPDQSGRIVNISSILGLQGVPNASAYCAAKHAVVGFTRALAHDVAKRGITVNVVCPGWVRTDMAHQRMQEIGIDEASLRTSVPLGRFVEPAEVAELVYFLIASKGAGAITGQVLTIDGGVGA